MRVFVGIPTPQLAEAIAEAQSLPVFQRHLRPSRLEAHITLKAPQIIADAEKWIRLNYEIASKFKPFNIDISESKFITPFTLALTIKSPAVNEIHNQLAESLAPFNDPSMTLYEYDDWIPHITIGRLGGAMAGDDRAALAKQCDSIFQAKSFIVDTVRLYAQQDGPYEVLRDITLATPEVESPISDSL